MSQNQNHLASVLLYAPRLTQTAQKTIAKKLGKSYTKAGFKPLLKGERPSLSNSLPPSYGNAVD